jgi:hypothetical protein
MDPQNARFERDLRTLALSLPNSFDVTGNLVNALVEEIDNHGALWPDDAVVHIVDAIHSLEAKIMRR